MNAPKAKISEGWRYDEAAETAVKLEDLLKRHGIRVRPGSILENDLLNVLRAVERKRDGDLNPGTEDIRPLYRTMIGVHELATLLLSVQDQPQFASLIPHLSLMNEGAVLQNTRSLGTDQASNKLFELYIGAAVLKCGKDLALDDPSHSKGDNPDVMITIAGQRWGIACKVLHGSSSEGFISNLEKGLDQIERSAADVGIVAFSLKNIIRHDEIWPLAPLDGIAGQPLAPAAWSDFRAPFELLVGQMTAIGLDLVSYLPKGYLSQRLSKSKSLPAFLLWGASPSAALINGRPTPCSVRALNCQTLGDLTESHVAALKCINRGIYADSEARP